MARISQIMANDKRFGGVITDKEWECAEKVKYTIVRKEKNRIAKDFNITNYNFLAFHTYDQRDLFIKENEDLLRAYFMIE